MKINSILLLFCLIIISSPAFSQQQKEFSPEELQRYEAKVKDITSFYFYLLNTLASKRTSPAEKEIIVTESYKKYFRDEDVQVEDDLDENREVPTNKDIAAYLKDVDFFFKDAHFDYEVEEITQHVNEKGVPYFKVALTRRLSGISVESDTLNNTQKRFIEVNISPEDQDLRIASIYTTKLSEKEDLINWWNELSYGWQNVMKDAIEVEKDSLTFEELKRITALKEIDIRENNIINSLEPVNKLTDLERLNIAYTRIDDLSPLRNLTKLSYLNATNTKIDDIRALRYAFDMRDLFIDNTPVDSIDILGNLQNLQNLSIRNTQVKDISALKRNKELQELYASGTMISSIAALQDKSSLKALNLSNTPLDSLPDLSALTNLKVLDISKTNIDDLGPVSELKSLEELRFDDTEVESLEALADLPHLKRIYSDYTGISRLEASAFMAEHPGAIVIFASDRLLEWWQKLDQNWKNALLKNKPIHNPAAPTKEDLAELTRLDSLNIAGRNISTLEPLGVFHQIFKLNVSENNISDIDILKDFYQLKDLNVSYNPIEDINILNQLNQLELVNIEGLNLSSLAPLYGHEKLSLVYAADTGVDDDVVRLFNEQNPAALIIYKSDQLKEWWEELEEPWQQAFAQNADFIGAPNEIELHKVIFLESFAVSNRSINDLKPLSMLLSPTEIILDRLTAGNLTPLTSHTSLKKLRVTGMPVNDLSPLGALTNLQQLLLSDTPVEDLDPLQNLNELRVLDLSSTQTKNIKPLCFLKNLEELNIANTRVRKLKHLYNLEQMEELICYNTRISSREIEKFKEAQPECRVVYYR